MEKKIKNQEIIFLAVARILRYTHTGLLRLPFALFCLSLTRAKSKTFFFLRSVLFLRSQAQNCNVILQCIQEGTLSTGNQFILQYRIAPVYIWRCSSHTEWLHRGQPYTKVVSPQRHFIFAEVGRIRQRRFDALFSSFRAVRLVDTQWKYDWDPFWALLVGAELFFPLQGLPAAQAESNKHLDLHHFPSTQCRILFLGLQ